jgi:phosphonate transport system permease protein
MKTFNLPSGATIKKPFNKIWIVLGSILLLIFLFSFFIFQRTPFFNMTSLTDILVKMFSPRANQNWGDYFRYMLTLREPLIETLSMALGGTIIGSVLAIPVAVLCAKNITKVKWIRVPVRLMLNLFRTIPVMLMAVFAVYLVGIGVLPGLMAITGFSFGIMAKMLFEIIETVDMSPYEALESTGATKTQAVVRAILPQVFPLYISYLIYIFEINVRASAIFGYFGAGGLGTVIVESAGQYYERVGATVILMLVVVVIIQFISNYVRGKLQ